MQDKLARHDGDIFETYELLEMLLFFRLPYKNTNPIAKRLLHRFGSLSGVFAAEREALVEVSGVGDRCAEFLGQVGGLLCLECDDEDVRCDGGHESWHKVTLMLHALLADNNDARLAIVAFDNSHRIISTELVYDVDINSGSMSAMYFTDFALRTKASVIVTASNRRYGAALPKPSDRESAAMISKALSAIDVHYAEHFIFSGDSYSRVLPTLSGIGGAPVVNEIANEETSENLLNENNCCQNSLVESAFGKTISAFCDEYSEKTRALFSRFGSLASIMMTDYMTLESIVGDKLAFFIRVLSNIAKRRIVDLVSPRNISNDRELGEYLSALCIPLDREVIFLISYDGQGSVISVDKVCEGTLNSSSVTPRALVEVAMRHSAGTVAVAHNHPYGKSELSDADITFTRILYDAFLSLGIELTKHFCISAHGAIAVYAPFDNT